MEIKDYKLMNLEKRLEAAKANLHRYNMEIDKVAGLLSKETVREKQKRLRSEGALWSRKARKTRSIINKLNLKLENQSVK